MDKAEYKIATEHIKKLISQGEYAEASHIADTIDWRRVKSVMMLCTVSDLYKVNRRYEDAKELLYMAYERNPESRTILYSLCDLSIKLEEFVAAIEYYKSFVEVAPRDTGRYVLQYRLYQAQDVSLEERIEVLEQLKSEEYIEKWAYELAYLYHRIGFATKCVEECDELILWFGKGRYVYKAMELKMLHEPLTPSQQYIYDRRFEYLEQAKDMTRVLPRIDSGESEMTDEGMVDVTDAPTVEIPQEYLEKELHEEVEEIQVKTLDVANAYNTMNLQKELAASLREILDVSHTESSVDASITEDIESEYADTAELRGELSAEVTEAANEVENLEERDIDLAPEADSETAEESVDDEAGEETENELETADTVKTEQEAVIEPAIWAEPAETEDVVARISNRIKSQTQDIFAAIEAEMKRDLFEVAVETEAIAGEEVLEENLAEMEPETREAEGTESAEGEETAAESQTEEAEETAAESQTEEAEETAAEAQTEEAEETAAESQTEEAEETAAEAQTEEAEETAAEAQTEEAEVAAAETQTAEAKETESETEVAEEKESAPEAFEEPSLEEDAEGSQAAALNLKGYEPFIRSVETEVQIMNILDNAAMLAAVGNIGVTGHDLGVCFDFIKVLLSDLKKQGMTISGRTAKISAVNLNKKEPSEIIGKVQGGILIIERAGRLRRNIAEKLMECLQTEVSEVLVFLTDTKQGMNRFFDKNPAMHGFFNLRVDIKDYTSDELIEHAVKYAYDNEYSIDEMGLLALRTRIEELLSNDEALTLEDAQEIIDEAIEHVNRKTFKHFMDILLHKRYDEEDMIILREDDFFE